MDSRRRAPLSARGLPPAAAQRSARAHRGVVSVGAAGAPPHPARSDARAATRLGNSQQSAAPVHAAPLALRCAAVDALRVAIFSPLQGTRRVRSAAAHSAPAQ